MKVNRTIAPELKIPQELNVPMPDRMVLDNGAELYVLNVGDLDVVRLSLVFRAGSRYQQHAFVAGATLGMIGEGSARYSSAEIAEMFDYYGSHFDVNIDRDYSVVTVCAISKFLLPTLELLTEIIKNPSYDESELRIYADKRKQQLSMEREKPSYRARELFGQALFGAAHPYGCTYDEVQYDELNSSMLHDFHKKFYTANDCVAVCSGHMSDTDVDAICDVVKCLEVGADAEQVTVPEPVSTTLIRENRDGALQSAIRVGKLMFDRNHQDFNGMQVLTTVLGGYFGSRLVTNLREEKGYTYGVFSTMVNLEHSGYLAIATEVATEVTEDAVAQIYFEIERLRVEMVSEDELEAVRNIMTGELMRILDGPFGIADVTIENIQNGMDNRYVTDFLHEIQTITPERLMQLAVRYFDRDTFSTVVVGAID